MTHKIFLKTNLTTTAPVEPSEFERLVQHIGPPIYERIPENNDETTFDRIRVIVGLPRYLYGSWEELSEEVLKYKPEILQACNQEDCCGSAIQAVWDTDQFSQSK